MDTNTTATTTTEDTYKEKQIPLESIEFDVVEIITIVRKRRQERQIPKGWTPFRSLNAVKEYVRKHARELIWSVVLEERRYFFYPVTTNSQNGANGRNDTDATPRDIRYPSPGIVPPAGGAAGSASGHNVNGNGPSSRYNEDRLGILEQPFYPSGRYEYPDHHIGHASCVDGGWDGHGSSNGLETSSADQALSDAGGDNLPGGREEVQEPQAPPSDPLQHDAGGIPGEVGTSLRLPHGGAELRSGPVGTREEDGPGAAEQGGTDSTTGSEGEENPST